MSSKTKIVVLRMKEIIYTAIFLGLGILLISLAFIMFGSKDTTPASSDEIYYIPGVYSSAMKLGAQEVNIEVTVDATQITGVSLVSLSESVETMYPLVQPSFEYLTAQIYQTQSLENLSYQEEQRYTSMALIQTIKTALQKAEVE